MVIILINSSISIASDGENLNFSSLKSIVLLNKRASRVEGAILPDIYLFEIPNKFVIGYGLDYNGSCRGLEGVYYLNEKEKK